MRCDFGVESDRAETASTAIGAAMDATAATVTGSLDNAGALTARSPPGRRSVLRRHCRHDRRPAQHRHRRRQDLPVGVPAGEQCDGVVDLLQGRVGLVAGKFRQQPPAQLRTRCRSQVSTARDRRHCDRAEPTAPHAAGEKTLSALRGWNPSVDFGLAFGATASGCSLSAILPDHPGVATRPFYVCQPSRSNR